VDKKTRKHAVSKPREIFVDFKGTVFSFSNFSFRGRTRGDEYRVKGIRF